MKVKHFLIIAPLSLLMLYCINAKLKEENTQKESDALYKKAQQFVLNAQIDSSLYYLDKCFALGFESPMNIIQDSSFHSMLDHKNNRAKLKVLIEKYTNQNSAIMVSKNEPGQRIVVAGKIVDENTNQPIPDVNIELIQNDNEGAYQEEQVAPFVPRLFAFLKTDSSGTFLVETIKATTYLDDEGNYVTPHMHFNLKHEDYKYYGGEFLFTDDSLFVKNGNPENSLLAKLNKKGILNKYNVIIKMQAK